VIWEIDEQTFEAWTPPGAVWSEWAKPVAFINAHAASGAPPAEAPADLRLPISFDTSSAVIVDLPGAEAVHAGLLLAERGFCPVPLFNGTSGPSAAIDVQPIARALVAGAAALKARPPAPAAAPAFLLDSRRRGAGLALKPGVYDNRWVTLPQDFPSAALLVSRGIRTVSLLQRGGAAVQPDLAHVLRRWCDQGMTLRAIDVASGQVTDNVTVPKPSGFRLAWYAVIALLGLRRSNVGGFGSAIPEQTSGGGGFG
jgi:hypothetical protein